MKKLIFKHFFLDASKFFIISLFIFGLIVWTIQAVNYFDFVTQDGHGLSIYFLYTLLNFPKVIHRLFEFIFFLSLFYVIISYQIRNELSIFWINGINKIQFVNKLILFSIILIVIQIFIGSYLSPAAQFKAREYLRNSNIDFFSSLIKVGKFINIAKGVTIFIDKEDTDKNFYNIFIEDNRNNQRMIYSKKGFLLKQDKIKKFKLIEGQIINYENSKVSIFSFDEIDLNLTDLDTITISTPKIQEINSAILINCLINRKSVSEIFNCEEKIYLEVKKELYKRFFKPIYLPLIALLCGFLFLKSHLKVGYNTYRNYLFFLIFSTILFSEVSIKYISSSNVIGFVTMVIPLLIFILSYLIFMRLNKNV